VRDLFLFFTRFFERGSGVKHSPQRRKGRGELDLSTCR
jgi:hypothetical protein